MKIGFVVLIFFNLCVALAQNKEQLPKDSLLERARGGDNSAVSQMQQNNDLQDLQALMRDPDYRGKARVRLSLAKLGDHDSLQFFACESLTDSGGSSVFMRDVLGYIGGEFAIQVYSRLLDSDPRFLPAIEKNQKKVLSREEIDGLRFPGTSECCGTL